MSHLSADLPSTMPRPPRPTGRALESSERIFRGANARAALTAVRNAFGDDAIVLETYEEAGATVVIARAAEPERKAPPPEFKLAPPRALPPTTSASTSAPLAASIPEAIQQLVDKGVAEHIARRVHERAGRVRGARGPEDALQTVLAELVEGAVAPWQRLADRRRRVVALLGPTGVGKTTTIAKMAARAILEEQQRVALITLDTWRIGAVEHIRRYGEIMDVPAFVARDAATLRQALDQVRDRELVLIDTAGRSPQESASFEEQLRTVTAFPEVSLYLTVAAGTGIRQLRAIRERYDSCGALLRLLITKVDESDGSGAVLNAAAILGRPVAGFADGQRVPEDLHSFDAASFAAQVSA